MKFFGNFLYAVVIGALLVSSPRASTDSTLPTTSHSIQSSIQQVAQADGSDSFKWAIKPKQQSIPQPVAQASAPEVAKKTTYFQRARSYGTHPESDPPRYVRNLAKTGIDAFKDLDWLDVGLDYRVRYELRDNDIRRNSLLTDHPVLLRTRGYVGIRNILDPFRMAVEFEDARGYNSQFPRDNRDWNPFELIQTYGELYFKDALGKDDLGNNRPLRIRGTTSGVTPPTISKASVSPSDKKPTIGNSMLGECSRLSATSTSLMAATKANGFMVL